MGSMNLNSELAHPELREKLRGESLSIHPDSVVLTENRYREFKPEELGSLMDSIRLLGLLQPVGVKYSSDPALYGKYEVIYGRRRVLAIKRLYAEALGRSTDPNHDNEVVRFSNIWALRFPKSMPDDLVRMLEIQENLERKELSSEEKNICILEYVGIIKRSVFAVAANTQKDSEYSPPPENGRGRPVKPVADKVARDLGVSRDTLSHRIKAVEAVVGPIDIESDTAEVIDDKVEKLKAHEETKSAKKRDRGQRLQCNFYTHDPGSLIEWFRKRHPDTFTLDDLCAYRDALITLCAGLAASPRTQVAGDAEGTEAAG